MIALLCALLLAASAATRQHARHVVIISFDQGGGPEIARAANMPVFHEMARSGAHDWQAYTIVPSITLPSHTSMLTGVGIQKHQIDWNDYRPEAGVVKVPTVFSVAQARGYSTALYAGKEKFKHLNLPGSIDHFEISGNALQVAAAFARDLPKAKYNLAFLHFADIDSAGHAHGLHSPEWLQALADTDKALGIVRDAIRQAGLEQDSVVILTADHGGHNVTSAAGETRGTHGSSKPEDVEIPWIAWGRGVKRNFNITAPVVTYDTSATALWLLGIETPEAFWGRPVTSAFVW
jgi:predicted AlkP superfamily pyrophosphatase or phosphodiesterase